jgi:hypothetical protein
MMRSLNLGRPFYEIRNTEYMRTTSSRGPIFWETGKIVR